MCIYKTPPFYQEIHCEKILFLAPQLRNDDAIFNSFSSKLVERHAPSGIICADYARAPHGYTCILEGPTHPAVQQ